ncbi:MAG: hypothetical protein R3D57_19115 [Hyphomicrobiaceae bacterium]
MTCLTCFVLGCLLTWRLIAPDASIFADGTPGRWAESPRDFQAFATASAIGLANRSEGPPRIVIAGTSLILAAFGSPERTQEVLQRDTGHPVEVAVLAAGANTLLHSFALLDMSFKTSGGIAILGINELTLGVSPHDQDVMIERSPLGFSSMPARALARTALGSRQRIEAFGPFDALRFYAARLRSYARNVRSGRQFEAQTKFPFEREPEGPLPDLSAKAWSTRTIEDDADFMATTETALAELDAIITHFESRSDVALVLMLDPLNLATLKDRRTLEALQQARERLEQLARRRGIRLSDALRNAPIKPAQFIDYGHIASETARNQLRHALSAEIAPLLGDQPE